MRRYACLLLVLMSIMFSADVLMAQHVHTAEVTKIDGFDRIVLAGGINLEVRQAPQRRILIRGERSVVIQVVCQVTEGELNIYATKFKYKKSKRIDVIIETPDTLRSIHASSGNKVCIDKPIPGDTLSIYGRYGSNIYVNVSADLLKVMAVDGSTVKVVGSARSCDLRSQNASDIKAFNLQSSVAEVSTNLMSSVDVRASSLLIVSATDKCTVRYKGSPTLQVVNSKEAVIVPVEDYVL